MTDEHAIYTYVGHNFASHGTIAHDAKEYVRGDVHTNTVEGFFSILKRGIYGVYQHVSEESPEAGISRNSTSATTIGIKLGIDDVRRAETALKGVKGKRLTYQTTGGQQAAQG